MSTSLDTVLDLALARTLVLRYVDTPLGHHHGLSLSDLALLLELRNAPGEKLRRAELASRLGVTPSGVARQLSHSSGSASSAASLTRATRVSRSSCSPTRAAGSPRRRRHRRRCRRARARVDLARRGARAAREADRRRSRLGDAQRARGHGGRVVRGHEQALPLRALQLDDHGRPAAVDGGEVLAAFWYARCRARSRLARPCRARAPLAARGTANRDPHRPAPPTTARARRRAAHPPSRGRSA